MKQKISVLLVGTILFLFFIWVGNFFSLSNVCVESLAKILINTDSVILSLTVMFLFIFLFNFILSILYEHYFLQFGSFRFFLFLGILVAGIFLLLLFFFDNNFAKYEVSDYLSILFVNIFNCLFICYSIYYENLVKSMRLIENKEE